MIVVVVVAVAVFVAVRSGGGGGAGGGAGGGCTKSEIVVGAMAASVGSIFVMPLHSHIMLVLSVITNAIAIGFFAFSNRTCFGIITIMELIVIVLCIFSTMCSVLCLVSVLL